MKPFLAALVVALTLLAPCPADEKVIRVGIIGLDTSHVTAFTGLLNGPKATGDLAGVRVVAAYPGGSPDVESSRSRVEGFTKTLREKHGIEIVDSIEALLPKVDAVLLESVDGRPHLKQVIPVFKAGKPVFIDKPVAGSLADAVLIYQLAQEFKVPCFSSSSLRFSPDFQSLRKSQEIGDLYGCDVYAPCALEEHHPDLFWYGVHGVEMLFTIMGTGCGQVTRTHTAGTDSVVGVWEGGRIGTFRGNRNRTGKSSPYGAIAFGTNGVVTRNRTSGYEPLVVEICKFFKTGKPPVSAEETIEIFAFMEAADESKRQGGKPVTLESVLAKAKAEAQRKKSDHQ